MPEFYSLYNEDGGFEIGETTPAGLQEAESFTVTDDFLDLYDEPDTLEVTEDDVQGEPAPAKSTVPGSDAEFVAYTKDSEVEVRETNWEEDKDPGKFIEYLEGKLANIPRHSGNTIPGCERAAAYIKALENEASQAMRKDFKGEIDEIRLEDMRKQMGDMIDRLDNHIERLRKGASHQVRLISQGTCKQCNSKAPVWVNPATDTETCLSCEATADSGELQKTAGLPVMQVYMTPFERAIVGTIINAKVSAGRNIEDVYDRLKNKYNFTPREELAIQQLIEDHGYPVYKDRGLLNEPTDPASGDGVEWQTNYHA